MPESDDFEGIDWDQSQTLAAFLLTVPTLDGSQKTQILEAAGQLIADHYAHLPHKRAAHGVDPAARLRALGRALPDLVGETSFHSELALVFAELRDLHTIYTLPTAYADMVVFLPFQLGVVTEAGIRRVIVTHVMDGTVDAPFKPGVEILSWSGVPIWRELERQAKISGGANPSASLQRSVASLTQRPMLRMPPPDAMWVEIEYAPIAGAAAVLRLEWRVCRLQPDPHRPDAPPPQQPTHLALDDDGDAMRLHRKAVFAPLVLRAQMTGVALPEGVVRDGHPFVREVPTRSAALRGWVGRLDGRDFGWLRLRSFRTQDADDFLDEIEAVLTELPQDGLVIDLRANPGGLVEAAERLLQFFTDRPVEPMRMQFLATEANLALCRAQTPANPLMAEDLSRWIPSLERARQNGAVWSSAYPMTDPGLVQSGGRKYPGPAVLVTSALSYSAADIFTAGWRDNGIGPILGVDDCTGAGGANRWRHSDIQRLARGERPSPSAAGDLPGGAGLRVAIRRALRVGEGAGAELEEAGIEPDHVHAPTRADLLRNDPDLITAAVAILRQ